MSELETEGGTTEAAPAAPSSGGILGGSTDIDMNEGNTGNESSADNADNSSPENQESWFSSLPEEYRDNPNVQKYTSQEEFIKGSLNAFKKIGEKGLEVPGENATQEEKDAFYSKIGRPDSPDAYDWQPPTVEVDGQQVPMANIDPDDYKETTQGFFEKGMNNEQVKYVMDRFAENEYAKAMQAKEEIDKFNYDTKMNTEAELRKEWGGKYDAKVQSINNLLNKFGINDVLIDNSLANDLGVIKMFDKVLSQVSEGSLTGDSSPSGGGFQDAVKAIKSRESYNPGHPDHAATMDELSKLMAKKYN